ncbi:SpoVR family protein [Klebsiella pneumoniae subsp. pneumoniae]|nr:SpoVR family protein [Klebsiella pneumoniae subsp. pneumoniae]
MFQGHQAHLSVAHGRGLSTGSPDIAGSDWLETLHFAMRDFKDESFISQFLSPKIMRDFRSFTVLDDDHNNYLEISAIHNEEGYREIRNKLSAQYNLKQS